MKIIINFEGLSKVLCQIGIHNWFLDDGFDKYGIINKTCAFCGKTHYKKRFNNL